MNGLQHADFFVYLKHIKYQNFNKQYGGVKKIFAIL